MFKISELFLVYIMYVYLVRNMCYNMIKIIHLTLYCNRKFL